MRDIPFMYLVFLVLRLLGTAFFLSPCGFFCQPPAVALIRILSCICSPVSFPLWPCPCSFSFGI